MASQLAATISCMPVGGMTKGQASPTTPELWENSKLTPYGTEVRPFQPCAIALAAGASFIARGYSRDPNNTARLVFEAMKHPGFAFIQILSQCITFCPEQAKWKNMVHNENIETNNPAEAATFLNTEDGYSQGIFYRQPRKVWPTHHQERKQSGLRKSLSL